MVLNTSIMLCNNQHHPSHNSVSCKTQSLYPLNSNYSFCLFSSPDNYHSTFSLCDFVYSKYLIEMKLYNTCLFCVWLIRLHIVFSRFIHVVVYVRISFLLSLNNFMLNVYATFCLSIHLSMDT